MMVRYSLRVMRRWRLLVVAGVLIGVLVGWVSAPGTAVTAKGFKATQTLILDPQAASSAGNAPLYQAALLIRYGAVPDRVADRLGIDRQRVRSMVSANVPIDVARVNVLLITGRSSDRSQAEALANVAVEELIVELGGQKSPLRTLEAAVASPIETDDIKGPTSRPGRAVVLGAFGLVLGVVGAFGVDRFDNRIRSKRAAEEALGVPVLAEVPLLAPSDRGQLVTGTQPSLFIEAYRGLRTIVDRWTSDAEREDGRRVIVVASATGGEGTTTTVAHLAVTLAEVGRSVVAISADLRRPRLHAYFGRPREPGLTDVLRGAPDARKLTDLNSDTAIRGVRFISSGAPVRNPAPLLAHIGDHLRDARSLGDIVLVDAPPLLTTSDGADLARQADGVLLVLRAGRTSVGAAARSVELLQHLHIPVLGAVLVASDGSVVRT